MLWTFHRLDGQGRVTGPGGMRRWRPRLLGDDVFACAATFLPRKGAIGRSPLQERGEVLGWARALSPRVRSRGLSWVFGSSLKLVSGLDVEQI